MGDAAEKNFQIIQSVLNDQAKAIRDLQQELTFVKGNVARLQAEIINTKQMNAHLAGRGMGSTVHN